MSPFRVDPTRIADVLAGVPYPARTWQLLAQADHYGADRHTHIELSRLPQGTYRDLDTVLDALRNVYSLRPRTPHGGQSGRTR
jgi:hypothetical protein